MAVNTLQKQKWIRRVIQSSFFLFVFLIVLVNYLREQGVDISWIPGQFHAICPFGAVETIGRFITQGKYIPKTEASNFWLFFSSIGATLFVGALFCGWICPLGSIQDLFGRLGKKIFKKRYNNFIPAGVDRALGYLRYVTLVLIVVQTTRMINLAFVKVDPYYALYHFWTGEALPSAIIVLVVVLLASLFVERPWCRWLCPFGAVQGIIQLVSPWKIRRNSEKCIDCGLCSKACPMNIDVARKKAVMDTRCNRCGECLAACPKEGGLDHSLPGVPGVPGGRSLSLRSRTVTAALALVLFVLPLIGGAAVGVFATGENKSAAAVELSSEDIKGTMTLAELAAGFGTDLKSLKTFLELPEGITPETKVMDLEDIAEHITLRLVRQKMENFSGD